MKMLVALYIWGISLVAMLALGIAIPLYNGTPGIILAFVVWCILFGNTFKHFIISVDCNTGIILFDPFFSCQRELDSGWRFKFPWETTYQQIDIRKNIVTITNETQKSYSTANGFRIVVEWLVMVIPRKGHLINYASNKPDVIPMKVASKIIPFLNQHIGSRQDSEIFSENGFKNLHREFSVIFKKHTFEDIPCDLERELGIRIVSMQIAKIYLDDRSQKAKSLSGKMDILSEIAEYIVQKAAECGEKMTLKEALKIAQVMNGTIKATSITYEVTP